MNNFDVIIPIKAFDWNVAKQTVKYVQKNIQPQCIKIISSKSILDDSDFINADVEFIDEDSVYNGLSLHDVQNIMRKFGMDSSQAGWYLQQFIKLAYSRLCNDNYYLVWDADTLPVRKIDFFDKIDQRPYLDLKREYHPRYFKTLKTLLGIEKAIKDSFIAEHMLINTNICNEVLSLIEENQSLDGNSFWEKILSASSITGESNSFSEFETLGTYFLTKHSHLYKLRKLETLRTGALYLGEKPEEKYLDWAGSSFDTISFEHSDAGSSYKYVVKFTKLLFGTCSLKSAILKTNSLARILSKTRVKKLRNINDRLNLRQEFDFMFNPKSVFEELDLSLNKNENENRSLFLDVTCLVNFGGCHVTGTERVVLSLAHELLSKCQNVNFIFRNFDDQGWYKIVGLTPEDLNDLDKFKMIRLDRHLFKINSGTFKNNLRSNPLRKRPAILTHYLRNRILYKTKNEHCGTILNRIQVSTIEIKEINNGSHLLVFHWFNPVSSYDEFIKKWQMRGGKVVFFFHDIIPLTNPEYAHPDWVPQFREYIDLVNKTADLVLTSARYNISEYKRYISSIPGKKITYPIQSIGLPVDFNANDILKDLSKVDTNALWLKAYKYCLCIGSIGPRKNHFELIQAWKKFHESNSYDNEILVIAGNVWGSAQHIANTIRQDNCNGSIVLLEDVSDQTLAYLYANCKFTVCLSLHEGWGLPVSESIAAGKPVIALNKTTLPEAGYGLAYLVDRNLPSIVAGFTKLFNDEEFYTKNVKNIISYKNKLPTWNDFLNRILISINDI